MIKGILPYFAYLGYRITLVVCVKAAFGETDAAFTYTTRLIRYPIYAKYGSFVNDKV